MSSPSSRHAHPAKQERSQRNLERIVSAVGAALRCGAAGVVLLHGTDTLETTGERLYAEISSPSIPVVLTGAMRPFEMKNSDALQNLTEAIFATGVLPPGFYCVAHGRTYRFPGVHKDRERGTFTGPAV